jgi:hypothetical protein
MADAVCSYNGTNGFFFNEIMRKDVDHPQPCPHPTETVRLAIISPAGNSDRPPSRRLRKGLRREDRRFDRRVRQSSATVWQRSL